MEGYLLECGQPVAAKLDFRTRGSAGIVSRVVVTPDSTGWYRVELPIGEYTVDLNMDVDWSLRTYNDCEDDTVRVGRAVRRRDFRRGRVLAGIRVPARHNDASAELRLIRTDASASASTTVVDGIATFDLRLVPARDYVLRFEPGDGGATVFLPGTYLIAGADSIHVGEAPVHYEADLNGRYARIEGRVTGSWQLTNMPMVVHGVSASGSTRNSVACAADGTFGMDLIAPDYVRMASDCNGMTQWFGGTTSGTATLYALEPGQLISGLELREGGLRLRFESPDLVTEDYGTIKLKLADGRTWYHDAWYQSIVDLPNLLAGDYRLQVVGGCAREPWRPQWYNGADDEADAQVLTVVEGSFAEATIVLQLGGVFRGRFVGDPVLMRDDYPIRLHDSTGAVLCEWGTWSNAEDFEWRGLGDGVFLLSTRIEGLTWWYPGTWELGEAEALVATGDAVVDGLVWQLPPLVEVIRK